MDFLMKNESIFGSKTNDDSMSEGGSAVDQDSYVLDNKISKLEQEVFKCELFYSIFVIISRVGLYQIKYYFL
jgi:hypothetical protein